MNPAQQREPNAKVPPLSLQQNVDKGSGFCCGPRGCTVSMYINWYTYCLGEWFYGRTDGRTGQDGSYQFLRAAGAPVRRRRGRGPPRHAKIDFCFLLARTFHENIFETKTLRKPRENLAKTSRNPNQNTRLIKRVSGPAPGRRHQFEQTYLFKKRCTNLYVYEQY